MKTFLPWLLAVLALGGAYFFYNSSQSKSAELAKLRSEVQELQTLRTEVTELRGLQVPAEEVAQLRKDKEDLLRLRNEVGQLRNEKQQLSKQAQSAQTALAGAQAESQRVQAQAQALAQARDKVLTQAQEQAVQMRNACINNLRQIDAAKQQWALERQKTEDVIPTAPDLLPYFKGGVMPVCPAGGQYTLNNLNTRPNCSVAEHALAQ
jgi:DNA repair ATPase RecN